MNQRLLWSVGVCLSWIALVVHCVPVEIVYTGDHCDCPSKLDYQINVPKTPKPRKCTSHDYGYKVETPVQTKTRVSYSFDFSVEEPRTPKPCKPSKLDLYAKVDRIAVNKSDCKEKDSSESRPPPCAYGKCDDTKPQYRYVFKRESPCKCRKPKCNCNLRQTRAFEPNYVKWESVLRPYPENGASNVRRKRDLQRIFFRPRKSNQERQGRFVKKYHKDIPEQQQTLFNFDSFGENPSKISKRKTKKAFLSKLHSKIVKRDIKGEYDLLEKERDQMDLTLPEIIQFMPETLQPTFKRGQCSLGCFKTPNEQSNEDKSNEEVASTTPETETDRIEGQVSHSSVEKKINLHDDDTQNQSENSLSTLYTKRNANDYNAGIIPLHSTDVQNAYNAQRPVPSIYINPISALCSPTSCLNDYSTLLQQQLQHLQNDGQVGGYVISQSSIPEAISSYHQTGTVPLQYIGDLGQTAPHYSGSAYRKDPIVGSPNYPVEYLSNDQLDKVISDIIYRHPEFIDATKHYGDALVDPEPLQEQQTLDFVKKLIDGRLLMAFGKDDDEILQQPSNVYPSPNNYLSLA